MYRPGVLMLAAAGAGCWHTCRARKGAIASASEWRSSGRPTFFFFLTRPSWFSLFSSYYLGVGGIWCRCCVRFFQLRFLPSRLVAASHPPVTRVTSSRYCAFAPIHNPHLALRHSTPGARGAPPLRQGATTAPRRHHGQQHSNWRRGAPQHSPQILRFRPNLS